MIISQPSNTTVSENMPVTLNCTVKASANSMYHKLVWREGDAYVQSDDHYSLSSSQFDSSMNTQQYFLTIHQVVSPAAYTCELLSTSYKVIGSKTQHIFVEKGEVCPEYIYM